MGSGADGGGFCDPLDDDFGIPAGIERGPVLSELGVAFGEGQLLLLVVGGAACSFGGQPLLGFGEGVQIRGQAAATEFLLEEDVDRVGDGVFAEVENGWVVDAVLVDVVA